MADIWSSIGEGIQKAGALLEQAKPIIDTVQAIGIKNNTAPGVGISQSPGGGIYPTQIAFQDKNVNQQALNGSLGPVLNSPIVLIGGLLIVLKVLKVI